MPRIAFAMAALILLPLIVGPALADEPNRYAGWYLARNQDGQNVYCPTAELLRSLHAEPCRFESDLKNRFGAPPAADTSAGEGESTPQKQCRNSSVLLAGSGGWFYGARVDCP